VHAVKIGRKKRIKKYSVRAMQSPGKYIYFIVNPKKRYEKRIV